MRVAQTPELKNVMDIVDVRGPLSDKEWEYYEEQVADEAAQYEKETRSTTDRERNEIWLEPWRLKEEDEWTD